MRRKPQLVVATVTSIAVLTACASAQISKNAFRERRSNAPQLASGLQPALSHDVLATIAQGHAPILTKLSSRGASTPGSGHHPSGKRLSSNSAPQDPFTATYRGSWVTSLCAIHEAEPNFDTQSSYFRCYGMATLTGHLDGHATEDVRLTYYADGSASGHMDEWIYARTKDNLCGGIQIDEYFSLDSATAGATVHGWGTVVGGTGGFTGVTGDYETWGIIPLEAGFGGYELTLRFPQKPQPSSTPCLPPLPPAPPAAGPPIN